MVEKRNSEAWAEAKKRCRLNEADIQMAKELRMTKGKSRIYQRSTNGYGATGFTFNMLGMWRTIYFDNGRTVVL